MSVLYFHAEVRPPVMFADQVPPVELSPKEMQLTKTAERDLRQLADALRSRRRSSRSGPWADHARSRLSEVS